MDTLDIEAERDAAWADAHTGCEQCGTPVCIAQGAGAHEDDCMCHGEVGAGVRGRDHLFCGKACRALAEDAA